MLKFPTISARPEPPLPKMSLLEYAEFSLECLKNNPAITPDNCMHKRTDEATMQPFKLPPPRKAKRKRRNVRRRT